jgi:Asp/Glu/hydantoin racemase
MTGPILFINPNSETGVTEGMRAALMPFAGIARIECVDIPSAPRTISSDEDAARAGVAALDLARTRPDAAAFVIACFSDPGVDLLRAETSRPVFGIQEAAVLTAMARADMFGIIALSARAIPRHRRRLAAMGVLPRMAAELPLPDVSALDAGTSDAVFAQTLIQGRALRDMGAGAVVLGCAGFAPRRRALEEALGIAVIDPVLAAAGLAIAAVIDG